MTAPGARVEPMNAVSHHSKVKATLRFAEQKYVSGENVAGKVELECKADKGLAVGIIMVELLAFEELLSRDHSAAQTFLHCRRVFQGPGLPPSNAVMPYPSPGDPPLPKDYYPARRGATTFLFRIRIPDSSPPSTNFGSGVARIRYEVRATIGVIWKGERQLVLAKHEINVIERYDPRSPLTRPDAVAISENGRIWVKGEIVGDGVFAGEPACVALTVKNHSTKKNTGLTVLLTRQLILPNVSQDHPLQILDTLTTVPFRGPEYIIHPGVEGVAHLIFDVPDTARTVKAEARFGGEDDNRVSPNLFSIKCAVVVRMTMGFGSKDIHLELPVTVYHPSVLDMTSDLAREANWAPVMNHSGNGDYHRPPTSPLPHDNVSPPPDFPVPWGVPFINNNRVYFPPATPLPAQTPPQEHLQPLLAPHFHSPARPSSAEPPASSPFYPAHLGHPLSSVPQPLPTKYGGSPQTAHREEGKGERASRITQHLRMSSRARSVSPPSHWYNMNNLPPSQEPFTSQPQPIPTYEHAAPTFLPSTPPNVPLISTANLSPQPAGSVISPRPMHSPKHTVTVDPFTLVSVNKSEDIDVLERVAAETVKANADMSYSVPDLTLEVDKTLPRPPVPSSKTKPQPIEDRPKVATLFSPLHEDSGPDITPRTPTIAAFSSPKASRAALGPMGGLDALEAKLLAEVGTRKVPQDRRPDVRTIMPIAIPRPDAVADPAVDSAISSLSLPGIGGDEGTLRLDAEGTSERGKSSNGMHEPTSALLKETQLSGGTEVAASKERSRKKSTPKPRVTEEIREKEQYRLRKAAQGRVAAWLGSIDPDAPPQVPTPPPESPAPVNLQLEEPEELMEAVPAISSGAREIVDEDKQGAARVPDTPEEHQDDKPDPRSSGFIPLGTLRKLQMQAMASGRAALPSKAKGKSLADIFATTEDAEARYDVRSARGGKGGIVTAVAAIWQSQAKSQSSSDSDKTPRSPEPRSRPHLSRALNSTPGPSPLQHHKLSAPSSQAKVASRPAPQAARPPIPPKQPTVAPSPAVPTTTAPTRASPSADLAARRAKMVKASSVPAVMSSSLAKPMLSSTASLARAKPNLDNNRLLNKLPPTISETLPSSEAAPSAPPKPQTELAFGKARLRELIQKYQG
ncbi:hypothetical protein BDW22DRAFT_1357238 [Trametopsis cervina]|nr:hypothetical protein BDW22DRAFT_1357238 [Trametopsis cervina]